METNTKLLADQILLAIEKSSDVKLVDSLDKSAVELGEGKAAFCLSQYVDAPLQGRISRRGPGGVKPLAMITYTVTIEAKVSEAFEDGGEDEDGFLFKGTWITDPTLDETLREAVNPWEYYGDAYVFFRVKKGMVTPAKK